jgi:hypothetical protein
MIVFFGFQFVGYRKVMIHETHEHRATTVWSSAFRRQLD